MKLTDARRRVLAYVVTEVSVTANEIAHALFNHNHRTAAKVVEDLHAAKYLAAVNTSEYILTDAGRAALKEEP